jgi:hypothetical protein
MKDIEIPFEKDRHGWYRFFEILPGSLTYLLLLTPILLSLINVTLAALFILIYILIYFARAVAFDIRILAGYRLLRAYEKLDWPVLLAEVQAGKVSNKDIDRPRWHLDNLSRLLTQPSIVKPNDQLQAVIVALYKESRAVLEPTIKALVDARFDTKKIILIIAYEERGGVEAKELANDLIGKYKDHFYFAEAAGHPSNIPGEVVGKGGNITFAGRQLQVYLDKQHIDPMRVMVTTLDADNRPAKDYFSGLSYLFALSPDPLRVSYQPLPMFTNNIWDVPAPMRAIAAGNNFFYLMLTQRPHLQRNFSAHAQSMRALIDMDFWSVRTIVEDGHQFWRSYFFYNGDYRVYPLAIPVYQDAVLAKGYVRTLKAQFVQLRRWTYGASDIAYIGYNGFVKENTISKWNVANKFFRTLESHVTWATGPLLILLAGFVPALLHPRNYVANELPLIISNIETFGLVGFIILIYVAVKLLPPRPAHYKSHRSLLVLIQWGFLFITPLLYGSAAAIYSQTRLMFKKYLTKFDTTEKNVINPLDRR